MIGIVAGIAMIMGLGNHGAIANCHDYGFGQITALLAIMAIMAIG